MPNGYDDYVDLEPDLREVGTPTAVAPPSMVAPSMQVPVAAPGQVAVTPPSPFLSSEDVAFNEMLSRVRDLPIAEAEQAVTTALKFQAIRGYQRDLAAGRTPAEALAKWAPIMFSQPKAGNLGQAAALVRAGQPQEKYMDVGGVGYFMKGGKAIPITPPKKETEPPITMTVPVNPDDPFLGGTLRVPMKATDPLVTSTLERSRAPAPAPVAPPQGPFDEAFGWVKNKLGFGAPSAATNIPPPSAVQAPITPVRPPPPAPVQTNQMPRIRTPEDKLAQARELRRLHPDWTKQQILDEVNR